MTVKCSTRAEVLPIFVSGLIFFLITCDAKALQQNQTLPIGDTDDGISQSSKKPILLQIITAKIRLKKSINNEEHRHPNQSSSECFDNTLKDIVDCDKIIWEKYQILTKATALHNEAANHLYCCSIYGFKECVRPFAEEKCNEIHVHNIVNQHENNMEDFAEKCAFYPDNSTLCYNSYCEKYSHTKQSEYSSLSQTNSTSETIATSDKFLDLSPSEVDPCRHTAPIVIIFLIIILYFVFNIRTYLTAWFKRAMDYCLPQRNDSVTELGQPLRAQDDN